jgi:hypothetical protein
MQMHSGEKSCAVAMLAHSSPSPHAPLQTGDVPPQG